MSKYGAKPTTIDGIRFASKREALRYISLKDQVRRGLITDLELQPKFGIWTLTNGGTAVRVATYKADFGYMKDGKRVIEDVKGFKTPIYRLKKKLVEAYYGIRIIEV